VRARIREYAGRLALVSGSLLACLVLLEIALQLGGMVLRATGREMPTSWLTGGFRILCLGDSNTYGVYLEPGQAYPRQLEALWNETGGPRAEILNLGFPGTNSSRLVSELPRLLDTLEPELVTVLVGANDFWTHPVKAPQGSPEPRGGFLSHSRVHRFLRLLYRRIDPVELEVHQDPGSTLDRATGRARYGETEIQLGWTSKTGADVPLDSTRLYLNLQELVGRSRKHEVRLVLLTYPSRSGMYDLANAIVRQVARRTGTPLVDLAQVFESVCPAEECPELLFPDHHPRPGGHRLIAETLLRQLRADEGPGEVR
jgi:lysophospholipase L1-like esterase